MDDDRLIRLQATVDDLRSTVRALERRVQTLEGTAGDAAESVPEAATPEPLSAPPAQKSWRDPLFISSLVGGVLLILAGGFLLRAMTDRGTLTPLVGVSLGFAYGLVWLVATDLKGSQGKVPRAVFHAIAAAMVAFPLLTEATTRFHVLTGEQSAGAITVLTAGMLFVAWHRRLHAVAWVTVLIAMPTAVFLFAQTGVVAPFALYLIALGIATLWMGYALDWLALRWPVALVADLVVLGVTTRALAPSHPESPDVAIFVQLALLTAYVVSIAIRTLVRGRNVIPFEVVQTMAALVVGFGGAVAVTRATGALPTMLGLSSLLFGAACYGVAFTFIDRSEDRGRNVYFYTTLAVVLVLVGFGLVLPGLWLGLVYAALAVVSGMLWTRVGRLFTLIHAAAYILAAAVVSDALAYGVWALAAGGVTAWELPGGTALLVLVAASATVAMATVVPASETSNWASAPRFVVVLVFVLAAGGTIVGYAALLVGILPTRPVDVGILATLRTVILSLATLGLAWLGRQPRFREWGWLVYPLLVGIGVKMVAQDFLNSRPVTLFIALALYGTALIVAPRLRRGAAMPGAQLNR